MRPFRSHPGKLRPLRTKVSRSAVSEGRCGFHPAIGPRHHGFRPVASPTDERFHTDPASGGCTQILPPLPPAQRCDRNGLSGVCAGGANWSFSDVPQFLPAQQVQKVLDSCDRSSALGKRDYAILLLLARLGLRANEVVTLTLDDVAWEAGVLSIRGKGRRTAQLPLPAEVGKAIVEYLREARPASPTRRLFIRGKAPLVGFAGQKSIAVVVSRALRRAGVESVRQGSHLLRHACTHAVQDAA